MVFSAHINPIIPHPSASHQSGLQRSKTLTRMMLRLLVVGFLCVSFGVHAQDFSELEDFIGPRDSILVTNARGQVLFSKNALQKRIPASILKVFTALVALHYLGEDYRFPTEFYVDKHSNLKIKGYGDPLLISEVIAKIAEILAVLLKNSNPLNDLVIDDSYFSQPLPFRASAPPPSRMMPPTALCASTSIPWPLSAPPRGMPAPNRKHRCCRL